MELIRGLENLHGRGRGCAVTIGTYDGLHLGHQALLRRLNEHATRLGAPPVLLTFEPTPREYLTPEAPPVHSVTSCPVISRSSTLRCRCAQPAFAS